VWPYIKILVDQLDPKKFEVEALGWRDGLEATEEVIPTEEWVRASARHMCELAALSGTKYAGWEWVSCPPDWKGLR
jgi:hypothetical protein